MTQVGVIAALPGEQKTLLKTRIKSGCWRSINEDTLICHSGMGPVKASSAANQLIRKGCCRLVSWGCAAALDNTLNPGDLLLPRKVITADGKYLPIAKVWHDELLGKLSSMGKIHTQPLIESTNLIAEPIDKIELGARTGAVALDMESASVARICVQYGIPFIVIRAVADPADMTLPRSIVIALDASGNLSISKLLIYTTLHPFNLIGLIALGMHYRLAQLTLRNVAETVNFRFCPPRDNDHKA